MNNIETKINIQTKATERYVPVVWPWFKTVEPVHAIGSPRVRKFRYLTVSVPWPAMHQPSTMRLVLFHSHGLSISSVEERNLGTNDHNCVVSWR